MPVKFPWIFPGASLKINLYTYISRVTWQVWPCPISGDSWMYIGVHCEPAPVTSFLAIAVGGWTTQPSSTDLEMSCDSSDKVTWLSGDMPHAPYADMRNHVMKNHHQIYLFADADCKRSPIGLEYLGHKNTTADGNMCGRWANMSRANFPHGSFEDNENYCRTASRPLLHQQAFMDKPWCFDRQGDPRPCNVTYCGMLNDKLTVISATVPIYTASRVPY